MSINAASVSLQRWPTATDPRDRLRRVAHVVHLGMGGISAMVKSTQCRCRPRSRRLHRAGGFGRNGNAPRTIHFGRRLDHRRHQLGTGTFTGEMTLPDGIAIAPTGNAFDLTVRQTTV